MPKQKISKTDVLKASMTIAREKGYEHVNARNVASHMGRSVQPIYSYFNNMEELKNDIYLEAMTVYDDFISGHTDESNIMESMAAANILFAKQEVHIFRLLFLSKLDGLTSFSDIYERMGNKKATTCISDAYNISLSDARDIYIMLIVFTHGIATLIATGGADINEYESNALINKAFAAFIQSHTNKT